MRIRRRRQPQRQRFSWAQLAFEVFVVVLGVTLALGLGRYYTFVGMYQETVRQSLGVVMETGRPTVAQVEVVLRLTSELQRELVPESCEGARRLKAEAGEPAAS